MKLKSMLCAMLLAGGPFVSLSYAADCLEVTITGVQGGPPVFAGQAGS